MFKLNFQEFILYFWFHLKSNHASFRDINNGVYRAGFATQQAAYEEAAYQLFKSLDRVSNYWKKINTIISCIFIVLPSGET